MLFNGCVMVGRSMSVTVCHMGVVLDSLSCSWLRIRPLLAKYLRYCDRWGMGPRMMSMLGMLYSRRRHSGVRLPPHMHTTLRRSLTGRGSSRLVCWVPVKSGMPSLPMCGPAVLSGCCDARAGRGSISSLRGRMSSHGACATLRHTCQAHLCKSKSQHQVWIVLIS